MSSQRAMVSQRRFAPHPPKLDTDGAKTVFEWTGRRLDFEYDRAVWASVETAHAGEEAMAWGPSLIAALREMGLKRVGSPLNALKRLYAELLSLRAENARMRTALAAERASRRVLAEPTITTAAYEGTEIISRTTGVVVRIPRPGDSK